jgi:hypothetical protein
MSFLTENTEKRNNVLFIALYSILIICCFFPQNFVTMAILLVFMVFGAVVYGFISKNPIKSYLFGFLISPTVLIISIVLSFPSLSTLLLELFSWTLIFYLLYSCICGVPGYLAALKSPNKFWSIIRVLLIILTILIQYLLIIYPF